MLALIVLSQWLRSEYIVFHMEDAIMKLAKISLIVILLGIMSQPALAHGHGGGVRFGLYVGAPVFWPGYYPAPYYPAPYYYPPPYYPPVVTVQSPPVYVQQSDVQQSQSTPPGQSDGYWYYCAGAKAYYPYVKQCAGGWQRVSPQPPPPS